ncbi:hypothetical protein CC86DRAFT_322153 [Ophiobolus disseminans]|uniref:Large ribosomal subunit protein bL27m n=1 Tax=Ophiobolus disseminans TaxID=1469910 RepID=A0A6A7A221_9PLEO|nr:hypothetical protein CC86DRAFT_322153 [Ophiobolus disseminans]
MLLPRILAPVCASLQATSKLAAPSKHVLDALRAANGTITSAPTLALTSIRHASHQSQGRANGAKDGPGKRLGAKKSGGEFVIPGNIIFRQRGTAWFPGENCKFGRDHCIYAVESGYVRYYRDPNLHPKRQYIGVALEKDHNLPYATTRAKPRRLGMVAVVNEVDAGDVRVVVPVDGSEGVGVEGGVKEKDKTAKVLTMGRGYAYREANWQIGRTAERMNVQVKQFVPGDRWTAWKRSQARIQANEEKKKLRNAGKKGGAKKKQVRRNVA